MSIVLSILNAYHFYNRALYVTFPYLVLAYLWHEFHNQDDHKRCHRLKIGSCALTFAPI